MSVLAPGIRFIDVEFLGVRQVIASAVIDGGGGIAIVDPGPSTSLQVLRGGLRGLGCDIADIRAILLTHIHLDHAGATGTLVQEQPGIEVYVHERGARHVIDPTRLLDSATRLYGAGDMVRLWGDVLPVPATNVRALGGGEVLAICGRRVDVAYTPGHASHHVSYLDRLTRIAFVGDVAGGRLGDSTFVMTPTPPPDIDLVAWQASITKILAWEPATLFLTHFGPSPLEPSVHLAELSERLPRVAAFAREALAEGDTDEARMELFRAELRLELRRHMSESDAEGYELAMPFDHCFYGLQRYWQKQG